MTVGMYGRVGTAVCPGARISALTSCNSRDTFAMSAGRCVASFPRQLFMSWTSRAGVSPGNASHFGSRSRIATSRSTEVGATNGRLAGLQDAHRFLARLHENLRHEVGVFRFGEDRFDPVQPEDIQVAERLTKIQS